MSASVPDAIRELHARYTDAVWRKDYECFANCFAEDAEWRIGGLELQGRSQIKETFEKIMGNFRNVLITFQSPILDVGETTASARTYINEQVARIDGTANISIGRYYERFAYEDGNWLFTWRLFQLHYSGPPDLSGSYFEWADYGAPPGMPPLNAPSGNFAADKWKL